jgi:hypothetical protein
VELTLLREENARLKVERQRPPTTGSVIELMRDLGEATAGEEDDHERSQALEAAQAIVECLAIRDGLLEACGEIQLAMQAMRGRLEALSENVQSFAGESTFPRPAGTRPADDGVPARDGIEPWLPARDADGHSRHVA